VGPTGTQRRKTRDGFWPIRLLTVTSLLPLRVPAKKVKNLKFKLTPNSLCSRSTARRKKNGGFYSRQRTMRQPGCHVFLERDSRKDTQSWCFPHSLALELHPTLPHYPNNWSFLVITLRARPLSSRLNPSTVDPTSRVEVPSWPLLIYH
jgi:hypothetical protein